MDDRNRYLRNLVVGAEEEVPLADGLYVTGINLDNAATTPPFKAVLKEVEAFIPWYSSVHRGTGYKSIVSSDIYEAGRDRIKEFVGADKNQDIVIYTKNTTEAINLLANMLAEEKDDETIVLSTCMEHIANDLPWRDTFRTEYIQIDACGVLVLDDLECKLKKYCGKVKLVTVTAASNVTGYKNPIHEIAKLSHNYGARIMVDGAQLVPHAPVSMKGRTEAEKIDFLVFSAHKMYAPFGMGALIGPKTFFERCRPVFTGGGAVKLVSTEFVKWDEAPYKHEPGTPNVIGLVALAAAIRTLSGVGMENVDRWEQELIEYTLEGLAAIPSLKLYCNPQRGTDRIGIAVFSIPGIHHRLLAKILAGEAGIAVRSGLFCAHPYVERLLGLKKEELEHYKNNSDQPIPGLVRASLGMYNRYQEIDTLLDCLDWIVKHKKECVEKYQHLHMTRVRGENGYVYRRETP